MIYHLIFTKHTNIQTYISNLYLNSLSKIINFFFFESVFKGIFNNYIFISALKYIFLRNFFVFLKRLNPLLKS